MSNTVRHFVRNCETCGRTHVWRDKKRGFLKPLPIPENFHQELSIDFMTDLPADKNQLRYFMVITDRLSKEIILEAMDTMTAELCAKAFLNCFYRFHGFPKAITSDRGSNWVGYFWKRLCKQTGIEQRLSTAFHLQTDGATERANQEVQEYLRAFVTYSQNDWSELLPAAQLSLNNRDSSLGYSPFYLTHGYHVSVLLQTSETNVTHCTSSKARKADSLVKKLEEGQALAQASMAWRQKIMEDTTNRGRQQAEMFKEGDCVWLNLKNISTPRPSKKLAWLHAKYRVLKIISPHVIELDVPIASQQQDDNQPGLVDTTVPGKDQEFKVEQILKAENLHCGRGKWRMVLVKWKEQLEPTWEPRSEFEDTAALDNFERKYGTTDYVGEKNIGTYTGMQTHGQEGG